MIWYDMVLVIQYKNPMTKTKTTSRFFSRFGAPTQPGWDTSPGPGAPQD